MEECHRSQMGSGAILRPAGLSAAARSLTGPEIAGEGWEGQFPPGAVGAEASGKGGAAPTYHVCLLPCASRIPPRQTEREIRDFQLLLIPSSSAQQGGEGLVSISCLQTAPGLPRRGPPVRGSPTHDHDAARPQRAGAAPPSCFPWPQLCSAEPPEVPPSCSARSAQALAPQTTLPLLPCLVAVSNPHSVSSKGRRSVGESTVMKEKPQILRATNTRA